MVSRCARAAQQLDQLVVDDLDDLLTGGQRLEDILAECLARGPGR